MVYRKERPRCRVAINNLLKEYDCTLEELLHHEYLHLTTNLKTQCRKMIEELKLKEFENNLEYEGGYPIIYCDLDKRWNQWFFSCPWCKRKHRHTPFPGHRNSHCYGLGDSPLKHGYIIYLKEGVNGYENHIISL